MADGSGIIIHGRIVDGRDAASMSFDQARAAGHIVCRCTRGCGHIESVDMSEWANSASRLDSLEVLARHLRCLCGSRDVRLEVWPIAPLPETKEHRAYFWR